MQRLTTLTAGPATLHGLSRDRDAAGGAWVGRSGLGDIILSDDGAMLFAANLHDGRVHRVAATTGASLGSFAHGGAGAPWGADARAFGLAREGDWLYHGVVEPLGATASVTIPIGHIYRSRGDGQDMREVARFPLDPIAPRSMTIDPWSPSDIPAISTIGFLETGEMVVGVRNLRLDAEIDAFPARRGDLLVGTRTGDTWQVRPDPERFEDTIGGRTRRRRGRSPCCRGWGSSPPAGMARQVPATRTRSSGPTRTPGCSCAKSSAARRRVGHVAGARRARGRSAAVRGRPAARS